MTFIIELMIWFIVEVVFWGMMYWTGFNIISLVSFGRWVAKPLERDRKKTEPFKATVIALFGVLFWIVIVITSIIIMRASYPNEI